MHALLSYPYRFFMCIWRLSIVLVVIFVGTDTAIAQVEPSRSDEIVTAKEENYDWQIGISFSVYSALIELNCVFDSDYCYDDMPYPYINTRVSYKNWQIISSWSKDQNEFIFNFSGRYNYYPSKKYRLRPFGFAGIGVWYFNRKWIYRAHLSNSPEYTDCQYDCSLNDNIIRYEKFTDPEFTYKLDKSRPDGKSIFPGLTGGIGIEYNMGNLVFTHEFDLYWTNCSYTEFICTVPDFKFLGIHFQF